MASAPPPQDPTPSERPPSPEVARVGAAPLAAADEAETPSPPPRRRRPRINWSRTLGKTLWTPARVIFTCYGAVILLGGILLSLPFSSHGEPVSFLDALFTSTSAVCVTGLIVVDTATKYTHTGQWIVMGLIELGGLGILTFTTWIMMLGRRPLGIFERAASGISSLHGLPFRYIATGVFVFTFLIEGAGCLVLHSFWHGSLPTNDAWFQSIFHSVSAFCNAGFSTLGDGLIPYRANWGVNLVISGLVVTGGLGFIVMTDLVLWLLRRRKRLTLHSRVALQMTAILLVGGTLLILPLEWNNTLAGMPFQEKLIASFFQSMTTRTAGFNTLNISGLLSSTLFVMILMMLIGASPGSTGGGMKTTTFTILLGLLRSQAFGRESVEIKRRQIPAEDVARALTTASMYVLTLIIGVTALMIVQEWGQPIAVDHMLFQKVLFECTSALGTVGLSMDFTSQLTALGKVIIIAMMFCGRLGPIAVLLAFIGERGTSRHAYAEESILTG